MPLLHHFYNAGAAMRMTDVDYAFMAYLTALCRAVRVQTTYQT